MMTTPFIERTAGETPLREMDLKIEGTPLEEAIEQFRRELELVGIRKLTPHFYLTTQWVVPDETIAIGIPFYLARKDLLELHAEADGHVEGLGPRELLRYLRHEMGHVVNYAYRLFDREEWVRLFGPMTRDYVEEYRPEPFHRDYVVHLPGWYAQKHPDEDWAETFAVWMTPGLDWRTAYAGWPVALAKLEYCDAVLAEVRDTEPLVTAVDPDWAVANLTETPAELYQGWALTDDEEPVLGIDGALRAVFEDAGAEGRLPASVLIRKCERDLMVEVFRWTGHFPERTRRLLRRLATRADELNQVYPADDELRTALALSALVTALAMNHVHRGSYSP